MTIEPLAVGLLHSLDLDAIGAVPGDTITLASRRGKITLMAARM